MPSKDPRIDAYIANAEPFARPILKQLRKAVHKGCPHVDETIKWSMPHFDYKGVLCGMAAFKAHCSFGFWKHSLIFPGQERDGMGSFGKMASLADVPPEEEIVAAVKKAASLNEN